MGVRWSSIALTSQATPGRYLEGQIAHTPQQQPAEPEPRAPASPFATRPMRHQIVFVYGSLLSGENHHSFLGGAKPLGEATTEPAFSLVDFGDFAALIPDGHTAVQGELYDVDAGLLARLDELEDHPDYLRRTQIRLADGREVLAYLLNAHSAQGQPRIECGNWRLRGQARRGA